LNVPDAPVSTYRLQLTAGFGFAAVADQADYLASLGVSHVYLSPILQAAPGSTHGYDVVDHSLVSADLGGEEGFRAMAGRLRSAGLGIVVDIVPNHMAIPVPESLNRQLWSVLREGRESPYAHWFDVDWTAHDGRMLLPVLARPSAELVGQGRDELAHDELVCRDGLLRYHDHVFPLREGTTGLPLPELLAAQHYQLASWRDASAQLNWRRFFDITTLIALRAEDPRVFDATHEVIVRLVREGLIDGLRVDHPDGLSDPREYLRRLAEVVKGDQEEGERKRERGGLWVVAEKILTGPEELPADWVCAGTTGYDTLALVDGLFLDPGGEDSLTRTYARLIGEGREFEEVERDAKRELATGTFAAELSRLIRLLSADRLPGDRLPGEEADLRAVLTELAACLRVYRAYAVPGEQPPASSVRALAAAAGEAAERLPGRLHRTLDAVVDAALHVGPDAGSGAGNPEFGIRFQQFTAPVHAKGVEDTAFYRWSRLVSLNEVGSDPGHFGVSIAEFHDVAARLARDWPATMTTLSTHDTKRAEDVRARLAVLAEIPGTWADTVSRWHRLMPASVIDPDTEYLLWQTLVGAWPLSAEQLSEYLTKAMREAKTRTSWTDPDTGYEAAALTFAEAARTTIPVGDFVAAIAPDARVNSLGAKLVQLTMPGVPDIYQGCELASYALVDPDNRRPVDFGRRRELLAGLTVPSGLDGEKLLVTSRALRLRRDHPEWFAGCYEPLEVSGPAREYALPFSRGGHVVTVAVRSPAALRRRGGWADTALHLDGGPAGTSAGTSAWTDVLTGARYGGARVALAELTRRLPVALLVREGA
jgi:(1->4)-alpha-D-glucan 1-alpha-D-glucosylmutase